MEAASSSSGHSTSPGLRITDHVLQHMAMGKVFKDSKAAFNSMDFHHEGKYLVAANDDESIHMINTETGRQEKVIHSKKYGVDLVRFTHGEPNTVICASKNQWDESLRYLSLHDNRYLRYFKGHRDRVVSLAMSPINDSFLSGSMDKTVRMWDLRTNACQGLLRHVERPSVAFDAPGLIFAVSSNNSDASTTVKLFDLRSFDKGPFCTFNLRHNIPTLQCTGMKFSGDGKFVLLSTNKPVLFLLDAFSGEQKQAYRGHVNNQDSALEGSFTPDAQYVLCGSEDGSVHVWHTETGQPKAVWRGHVGSVAVTQWNPRFMMAASADNHLVLWRPDLRLSHGDSAAGDAAASHHPYHQYT
ncbi:WD repeat-containing protein 82 [Balamuthia mandrillaris]